MHVQEQSINLRHPAIALMEEHWNFSVAYATSSSI